MKLIAKKDVLHNLNKNIENLYLVISGQDYNERRAWIRARRKRKRKRKLPSTDISRKPRYYYLGENDKRVNVCLTFFYQHLDLKRIMLLLQH